MDASFIAHAHFRIAAIVLSMTIAGARVSEACRIKVRDVDWDGNVTFRKTKTGRARRTKCPDIVVKTLQTNCKHNNRYKVVFECSSRFDEAKPSGALAQKPTSDICRATSAADTHLPPGCYAKVDRSAGCRRSAVGRQLRWSPKHTGKSSNHMLTARSM